MVTSNESGLESKGRPVNSESVVMKLMYGFKRRTANAKSLLGILSLWDKQREKVLIVDEAMKACLHELEMFVNRGMTD